MFKLNSPLFEKFQKSQVSNSFKVMGGFEYTRMKTGAEAGANDTISDAGTFDYTGRGDGGGQANDSHSSSSWH